MAKLLSVDRSLLARHLYRIFLAAVVTPRMLVSPRMTYCGPS